MAEMHRRITSCIERFHCDRRLLQIYMYIVYTFCIKRRRCPLCLNFYGALTLRLLVWGFNQDPYYACYMSLDVYLFSYTALKRFWLGDKKYVG